MRYSLDNLKGAHAAVTTHTARPGWAEAEVNIWVGNRVAKTYRRTWTDCVNAYALACEWSGAKMNRYNRVARRVQFGK